MSSGLHHCPPVFTAVLLIFTPLLGLRGAILATAAHPPPHLEVLLGRFTASPLQLVFPGLFSVSS